MVTAETAALLPAFAVLAALALWGLVAAGAWLRCSDAVAVAVRLAMLGRPLPAVAAAARSVAPPGAAVDLVPSAGSLRVTVSVAVRPFGGPARRLPALRVADSATVPAAALPAGGGPTADTHRNLWVTPSLASREASAGRRPSGRSPPR